MIDDLRGFLDALKEKGKLRTVENADWDLEIGTINELMAERQGPGLIFDHINGYPPGYRVATNLMHHRIGQKLAFGFPDGMSDLECVADWKDRWNKFVPVPPVEVKDGPIRENILTGDDIDIYKIPTPKWHTHDGGRYIGTGVITITRDPDEGWVNTGTYRVMIQDKKSVGVHVAQAHHGFMHIRKALDRNESIKIAISVGHHPAFLSAASMEFPYGYCEYDFVGALQGEPVQVIEGPYSGLPIPADSEIVLEGEIVPGEVKQEGPLGEWTGYYVGIPEEKPLIRVHSVLHRNDPIILGAPPVRPPAEHSVQTACASQLPLA